MENELHHLPTIIDQVQHAAACILYFYSDRCAPCVSLRPKNSGDGRWGVS